MPFWAQAASHCAKEVPQAPEKLAFDICSVPGGLSWHSKRLPVPKKVCRFSMFVLIPRKEMPTKTVLSVVANLGLLNPLKHPMGHGALG